MATSTGTIRVLLIPLLTDDALVNDLFAIPALIQAQTNAWFSQLYATEWVGGQIVGSAPTTLVKTLRVEVLTTTTNDANLIATTLPALQTQLGLTSPILTWSYSATVGY